MERQYTNSAEAWDAFMRGAELYRKSTQEDNAQARALFEKAIKLDPKFARAYASLAATYRQERGQDLQASEQRAFDLAQQSVALDPSLPQGHHQLAYLYLYRNDHDNAIKEAREAIRLDPNDADGYAALAVILAYANQPQEAIRLMEEEAIPRNPIVPAYYFYHLGMAYYVMQQYDKAEDNLLKALRTNDKYRPARGYLVAVYSETHRKAEAKDEMKILLAQKSRLARLLTEGTRQDAEKELQRITPYKDLTIRERLRKAWQEAAH